MGKEKDILIKIEAIYKKFCADIKRNMLYGIQDTFIRHPDAERYMTLRTKEFWALQDISFNVNAGDIVGILGTNGSGKTTLMRLIADIYDTNVGSITMTGSYKITPIFALKSGMSPVFSGRENVYIKGAMLGLSREEIDDNFSDILSFSEIGDFIDMPFGNYSSGMGARLAYAIAVATNPNIFIIDEALAVGDDMFKEKCFNHLRTFVQKPKKCVLFVSNNIDKVSRVANRIVVLDKGKLLFDTYNVQEGFDFYLKRGFESLDDHAKQKWLLDNQQSRPS
jgi:lipopolysaccharide transport system ATP-binding protein